MTSFFDNLEKLHPSRLKTSILYKSCGSFAPELRQGSGWAFAPPPGGTAQIPADYIITVFASEVLHILLKSSKSAQRYCIFESRVFRAALQNCFRKCETVHTKPLLLLISAIPPGRFGDFANQLGGIAQIYKSSDSASEVLRFSNSLFRGALKTTNSENAIPLGPNA